jgi:hypothetical protein
MWAVGTRRTRLQIVYRTCQLTLTSSTRRRNRTQAVITHPDGAITLTTISSSIAPSASTAAMLDLPLSISAVSIDSNSARVSGVRLQVPVDWR